MSTVHIANHSAREISFYERTKPGTPVDLKKVAPGRTIALDSEFWDEQKDKPSVKGLLDIQALEVVKKPSDSVPIGIERTADPEIPEHLQSDEQIGAQTGQSAKLVKAERKTIEMPGVEA